MRQNRMYTILKYAKEKGLLPLKCSEMQNLQREVENFLYTKKIKKGIEKIQLIYYTKKEWDEILGSSGSFYFVPDIKMERCNNRIKVYVKEKIGFVPAQLIYSWGIFSGQLSSMFRKSQNVKYGIKRFKIDGIYRYSI